MKACLYNESLYAINPSFPLLDLSRLEGPHWHISVIIPSFSSAVVLPRSKERQ